MAGNSVGSVPRIKVGQFSAMQQREPNLGSNLGKLNAQDNFFRQGTTIRPLEQLGIRERQHNAEQQAAVDAKNEFLSVGQQNERASEANTEGDVAIGRLGRNHPGDTRFASVLKALGVAPDFMNAVIQSAQIRQSDNR